MAAPFIQDRESGRRFFCEVWDKHRKGIALESLEDLVLGVIMEHPEYHDLLEQADAQLREFTPEQGITNPFLHMGMHIAIREQVASDRPAGMAALYRRLLPEFATAHDLEHRIMECLGETLWVAQRNNTLPDENAYLECIRRIKR